jgi:hypothetical protein
MDEEDVNTREFQTYFQSYGSETGMEAAGVLGSYLDDAVKTAEAIAVANESGDKDAWNYAALSAMETTMVGFSRVAGTMGGYYGIFNRMIKEIKKNLRHEYNQVKADLKEEKKLLDEN